ncbi:MAG TPA: DUF3299 domain-containing protein [Noviherbaspirillum sp.]|nr:DUF3299 domain-containing protein [Noviherbaspirillum sp.]
MKASLLTLLTTALSASMAIAAPQAPPAQGHVPPPNAPPPVMQPLPEIKGVVSWETLAKVKQIRVKNRILPEFSKAIAALNDTEVKVQGFMMPLEPGEKQKHFLISLVPQSCSFCMPAGPEGVVEVQAKTAVKYTFEPIVVSGKMSVLKDDPMGMYYRLTDATPVSLK